MKNRLLVRSAGKLLCLGLLCLLWLPGWAGATDYAMQMEKAASSLLLDIAAAGDRLVAVGERGHILYSNDNGRTWVQATVPTSVMLTRVFFISENTGWAVGHDGNILFSQDGGVNWDLQRDGVSDQARINEERLGRAREELQALRERLDSASDEEREDLEFEVEEAEYRADVAREVMEEPVYAPPLMDIWFANEEQGFASGAYGTLLHTANGGRHWDDWSHKVDNPEELHLNGVTGGPDGHIYLASEWGYVFRSTSGLDGWEVVETGYEGSFFGVLVSPASGSVFAYGLLGTVYRSTDSGESWEELQSMARSSLFGAHVSSEGVIVLAGQGGTVVRTGDDGESFVPLPQPSRRGLHGIAPTADGGYVVTGEGGSQPVATETASRRLPATGEAQP